MLCVRQKEGGHVHIQANGAKCKLDFLKKNLFTGSLGWTSLESAGGKKGCHSRVRKEHSPLSPVTSAQCHFHWSPFNLSSLSQQSTCLALAPWACRAWKYLWNHGRPTRDQQKLNASPLLPHDLGLQLCSVAKGQACSFPHHLSAPHHVFIVPKNCLQMGPTSLLLFLASLGKPTVHTCLKLEVCMALLVLTTTANAA